MLTPTPIEVATQTKPAVTTGRPRRDSGRNGASPAVMTSLVSVAGRGAS